MNRILLCIIALLLGNFLYAQSGQQEIRVLCIGNSFTYVEDTPKMLEEIAASQGLTIKITSHTVGGYTFKRHLNNDKTISAIDREGYMFVFLQDQSQAPARYAKRPKTGRVAVCDGIELVERVRFYSPEARIWLEQTWAYSKNNYGGFGSLEEFDRLLGKGTRKMARKAHVEVSPIGPAFAVVRAERPDIDLYNEDGHHQSRLGAYLKSCVNFLLITGKPFDGEVANCENDPQFAAYLRSIAERVVFGDK